ncbi:MAG: hypothetical protein KDE27_14740 [Planctomycetes bacterium]|nr:hypothetical protein [Planctomycetota bacterium]
MKLDPVFLLAPLPPEPRGKVMSTRRAFLLAGGMFAAGTAIGGACGYSLGAASAGADAPGGGDDWEPSDDAELEELRRLAVKAPMEELLQKGVLLVTLRSQHYRDDPILWRGVARIANALAHDPEIKSTPTFFSLIIQQIENGAPPTDMKLNELVPALRARRDEVKNQR